MIMKAAVSYRKVPQEHPASELSLLIELRLADDVPFALTKLDAYAINKRNQR